MIIAGKGNFPIPGTKFEMVVGDGDFFNWLLNKEK